MPGAICSFKNVLDLIRQAPSQLLATQISEEMPFRNCSTSFLVSLLVKTLCSFQVDLMFATEEVIQGQISLFSE